MTFPRVHDVTQQGVSKPPDPQGGERSRSQAAARVGRQALGRVRSCPQCRWRGTTPATVTPTTLPSKPITPPDAKAVATALAFMRREVGMANPIAGPFRWTGARSGQVDIRARIPGDANALRGPATTVSLQRLTNLWYVLGVSTGNLRVVSPRPEDPIRSPVQYMADIGTQVDDRVRVRVTQDRYGTDVELGRADVTRRQESPYVDGQVAFQRPTATTGSVVFTRASGRNGEVTCATVVRIRFATVAPPQTR